MEDKNTKLSYDAWHANLAVDTSIDTIWHQNVINILDAVRDIQDKRIIEIGCGRGGFACWLATHSSKPASIIAADYSSEAVKKGQQYAQSVGINGIEWQEADIQCIPFENNSFDTVFSFETIEHVPNPAQAVKELSRVLKPGGKLYLTTPNYMNLFGLWRIYRTLVGRPYTEAGQPINKFVTLPVTLSWVKNSGLEIISYGSFDFVIPQFKSPPKHINLPSALKFISRWLGLQSYVVAQKTH